MLAIWLLSASNVQLIAGLDSSLPFALVSILLVLPCLAEGTA